MQMKGIEELYLDEMRGVKNIVYDLDRGFSEIEASPNPKQSLLLVCY